MRALLFAIASLAGCGSAPTVDPPTESQIAPDAACPEEAASSQQVAQDAGVGLVDACAP